MGILPAKVNEVVTARRDYWALRQAVKDEAAELAMLERTLGEIQHSVNVKRAELAARRSTLARARVILDNLPINW